MGLGSLEIYRDGFEVIPRRAGATRLLKKNLLIHLVFSKGWCADGGLTRHGVHSL